MFNHSLAGSYAAGVFIAKGISSIIVSIDILFVFRGSKEADRDSYGYIHIYKE